MENVSKCEPNEQFSRSVFVKMYSRKVELRNVELKDLKHLCIALDSLNSWKLLMEKIPKDLNSNQFTPKYNCEHIKIIEREGRYRSPTEVLLDEWGTSGRKRPNLETLLNLLIENDLFRAADIVAVELLGEQPPKRPPRPWSPIPIPHVDSEPDLSAYLHNNYPGTDSLNDNISEHLALQKEMDKSLNLSNVPDLSVVNISSYVLKGSVEFDNIPDLSALNSEILDALNAPSLRSLDRNSRTMSEGNITQIRALNAPNGSDCASGETLNVAALSDGNIPQLSALNASSTSEDILNDLLYCGVVSNSCTESDGNIPQLSALNAPSEADGASEETLNVPTLSVLKNKSGMESDGNIPQLSALHTSCEHVVSIETLNYRTLRSLVTNASINIDENIPQLSALNTPSEEINVADLLQEKLIDLKPLEGKLSNEDDPEADTKVPLLNELCFESHDQIECYNLPILSALNESHENLNIPILSELNKRTKSTRNIKIECEKEKSCDVYCSFEEANHSTELDSSKESSPKTMKKIKMASSDLINFSSSLIDFIGTEKDGEEDSLEESEELLVPNLSELQ